MALRSNTHTLSLDGLRVASVDAPAHPDSMHPISVGIPGATDSVDVFFDELLIQARALGMTSPLRRVFPRIPTIVVDASLESGTLESRLRIYSGAPNAGPWAPSDCLIGFHRCTGITATWGMDHVTSGRFVDSGDFGLHLTPVGGVTRSNGIDGLAASFDGTGYLLAQKAGPATASTPEWNVEAMVAVDGTGPHTVASFYSSNGSLVAFLSLDGDTLSITAPEGGAGGASVSSNVQLTPSGSPWVYVSAFVTNTTIRAIGRDESGEAVSLDAPLPRAETLVLGGRQDATEGLVGRLDAVRLLNRLPKPAEQIQFPSPRAGVVGPAGGVP